MIYCGYQGKKKREIFFIKARFFFIIIKARNYCSHITLRPKPVMKLHFSQALICIAASSLAIFVQIVY